MSRAGKPELRPLQPPPELQALLPGMKTYRLGGCWIMVAVEDGRWHLSISRRDRLPNWEEVKRARYELVPDEVTMAMLLPPEDEYVNVQEYCFHLWQI
jgi:hypothetical protein